MTWSSRLHCTCFGHEDGAGGVEESAARPAEGRDEKLPPKVNTEVEVLQQGVTKQIIKEGHGNAPPSRHSTCFGMSDQNLYLKI